MLRLKKIMVVAIIAFVNFSCSNDGVQPENDSAQIGLERMFFETTDDFYNTVDYLLMNESEDGYKSWLSQFDHNSALYNYEKLNVSAQSKYDSLPNVYLAIFDKNLNIQIGDKVYTYSNGNIIPMEFVAEDLNEAEKYAIASSEVAEGILRIDESKSNLENRIMDGSQTIKWWVERNRQNYSEDCTSGQPKSLLYRLVNELKTIKFTSGGERYTELSINFRMSMKLSDWQDANETKRQLDYGLDVQVAGSNNVWFNNGRGVPYVTDVADVRLDGEGYLQCSNLFTGKVKEQITVANYQAGVEPTLNVYLKGSVTQGVNGDTYNFWTQQFNDYFPY